MIQTYRVLTIFKHPKDILHNDIVLHFDKLGDLFSNPRTEDRDVDFAEIDFFREMFREFCGFDAGKFLVFEPLFISRSARVYKEGRKRSAYRVLKGICAPHTCVCHGELIARMDNIQGGNCARMIRRARRVMFGRETLQRLLHNHKS